MHVALSRILGSAVLATALVACSGGDKKTSTSKDMAVSKGSDMGVKTDASVAACTDYGPWATDQAGAYSSDADPSDMGAPLHDYQEGVYAYQESGTLADVLQYDYFHLTGGAAPTTPTTVNLASITSYLECQDCLQIFKDVDPADSQSGTLFFADSGSLTISKRDHGGPTGTVAVSATGPIHFSEWDVDADAAKVDGACLTVSSFSITGDFDNTASTDM